MAKLASSTYVGSRSEAWVKIKCIGRQEFVIGGFTDPKRSRVGLGALLVGYYADGQLVYAGKVGTGFTREVLLDLRRRLDGIEVKTSPLVGEGQPGGPLKPTRCLIWRQSHNCSTFPPESPGTENILVGRFIFVPPPAPERCTKLSFTSFAANSLTSRPASITSLPPSSASASFAPETIAAS